MILSGRPAGAALVLVIDQLEEVFTLTAKEYLAAFVDLLAHAACYPHLRVLTTLRANFLPPCGAAAKASRQLSTRATRTTRARRDGPETR